LQTHVTLNFVTEIWFTFWCGISPGLYSIERVPHGFQSQLCWT
jgi:hypothetical protein